MMHLQQLDLIGREFERGAMDPQYVILTLEYKSIMEVPERFGSQECFARYEFMTPPITFAMFTTTCKIGGLQGRRAPGMLYWSPSHSTCQIHAK